MGFLSRFSRRLSELRRDPGQTAEQPSPVIRPAPAPAPSGAVKYLVADGSRDPNPPRHYFTTQLEIGRDEEGRSPAPGLLLVRDPIVSFRHCVISQTTEGHCFVRDVSRNGTRLDGRRLVPNVETEIRVGQTLDLGAGVHFILQGDEAASPGVAPAPTRGRTEGAPTLSLATVLVGDIRDYTVMVRKAPAAELQQSVSRVFDQLTSGVVEFGGTVKEFPGDAILAFWEGRLLGPKAVAACRAAIELDRRVRGMASDPSVWSVRGFPLRMDWALASGEVSIDGFGGATTMGLSMIGEPVVLACRIEKFITDRTGPILTCPSTRDLVMRAARPRPGRPGQNQEELLEFEDLGLMQAKGFDAPDHVFALQSRRA